MAGAGRGVSRRLDDIVGLIRRGDRFLVTSHVNPDGDAVASQLALQCIFQALGKSSVIVSRQPVPRIYRFLPRADEILVRRRHSLKPYSAVFVLDCGSRSRASALPSGEVPLTVVNIDHHVSNTGYGDLNWIRPRASSTCEMIFDLARRLQVPLSRDLAVSLYTGILTDTGSFRYSSTTPRSMSVAGRLLRSGVDAHEVAGNVYDSVEYQSLRLLGRVLARMGRSCGGRVSWVTFSHAELSSLSNASETEEFVNYARSLDSAVLAIGLKEVSPGEIRVSFRSKGDVNVSDLASRHGGGGHRNAAGCTLQGSLRSVRQKLVAEACHFLGGDGAGKPRRSVRPSDR